MSSQHAHSRLSKAGGPLLGHNPSEFDAMSRLTFPPTIVLVLSGVPLHDVGVNEVHEAWTLLFAEHVDNSRQWGPPALNPGPHLSVHPLVSLFHERHPCLLILHAATGI